MEFIYQLPRSEKWNEGFRISKSAFINDNLIYKIYRFIMALKNKKPYFFVACFLFFSLASYTQKNNAATSFNAAARPKNLSDTALLDLVQKQTLRYFWDFAHPISGLARERSNMAYDYGWETTTTGGTGFGIMSIIVGVERGWISRDTAVKHLLKMVRFLAKLSCH